MDEMHADEEPGLDECCLRQSRRGAAVAVASRQQGCLPKAAAGCAQSKAAAPHFEIVTAGTGVNPRNPVPAVF
jgi:hypothetical protein